MDASIAIVVAIVAVILGIAISVGLFFLFRAITCWYFKINKIVDELKKIDAHLARMAFLAEQNTSMQQRPAVNPYQATAAEPVAPAAPAEPVVPAEPVAPAEPVVTAEPVAPAVRCCVNCGNQLSEGALFCTSCGTKN